MTTTTPGHTKFGILSCLIAAGVWIYLVVIFVLVFYVDGFTRIFSDAFVPESRGISDLRGLGTAVVIFAALFFFIPLAGHIAGLLLGLIGLFRTNRTRLFAAVGTVLNLLPAATLVFFYLIGSLFSG